jgi:hypothetical protein
VNQHFIDPNDIQQLIETLESAAARKWPAIPGQQHSLFGLAAQALRKLDKPEQPTLRDYFAAKALPEIIRYAEDTTANNITMSLEMDRETEWDNKYWYQYVAMRAYAVADAMLGERQSAARST